MTKIWVLAIGSILWGAAAMAGPPLPDALVKQVSSNPDAFARMAAGAILGHGKAVGLTAEGVAQLVAVEQARIRTREAARLLKADLDGDARVTRDEMAVTTGLEALSARAGLDLLFRAADADGDGVASMPEVYAMAEARAAADAARMRTRAEGILACDRDGDGAVRIDEVLEVIAEVRVTRQAGAGQVSSGRASAN